MKKNELNKYLNKLSILVLSFNKELSIRALVNYWSKYPVELIILDGSYQKINLIEKDDHHPNFKLSYYYEPISYSERIKKATYIDRREYSLLSADDEIFLPRGIARSIKFLEENIEYNSSIGQCYRVIKIRNNLKIGKIYQKLKAINATQKYKNMEDRIVSYFNNYVCATFYSVMRSYAWNRNFSNSFSISISCPFAIERTLEFTNIAYGKCHVHNTVSWIRNGINKPNYDLFDRSKTLDWWLKSKSVKKEHDDIKKLMSIYGVEKENISTIFSQIFKEPKRKSVISQIKQFLILKT